MERSSPGQCSIRAHARGNERLSVIHRGTSEYPRWGSGEAEVGDVTMLDGEGNESHVFETGLPFVVRMRYRAHERCKKPVFGIGIYRSDGTYVNGSNHEWRDHPIDIDHLEAGEEGEVEMRFDSMPMLQGLYYLTIFLIRPQQGRADEEGRAESTTILNRHWQARSGLMICRFGRRPP